MIENKIFRRLILVEHGLLCEWRSFKRINPIHFYERVATGGQKNLESFESFK